MSALKSRKINSHSSSMVRPVTLAILLVCAPAIQADDVTDQIDEAVKAYEKEDYNTAVTALDSASTLIRQKKGELVSKLLPEPLDGWEAGEGKSSAAAAGMFGGGWVLKDVIQGNLKAPMKPSQFQSQQTHLLCNLWA